MSHRSPPLIFLHIPKTGGQTLNHWLRNFYLQNETYQLKNGLCPQSLSELQHLPAQSRRLIAGHMPFGLHERLQGSSEYLYTAFVREPIARAWSHYLYALHTERHHAHSALKSGRMKMLDYLSGISNDQCRYLAGDVARSSPEELLDKALANIRSHFISLGILERFDQSVVLLQKKCGWGIRPCLQLNSYRGKHRTKPPFIPYQARALLEEINQADLQLFQAAQSRFNDEIRRIGTRFGLAVVAQKTINQWARVVSLRFRTRRE